MEAELVVDARAVRQQGGASDDREIADMVTITVTLFVGLWHRLPELPRCPPRPHCTGPAWSFGSSPAQTPMPARDTTKPGNPKLVLRGRAACRLVGARLGFVAALTRVRFSHEDVISTEGRMAVKGHGDQGSGRVCAFRATGWIVRLLAGVLRRADCPRGWPTRARGCAAV